jgi:hypothetical protein
MPPGPSIQAGWADSWRTPCSSSPSPEDMIPLVLDLINQYVPKFQYQDILVEYLRK